MQLTRASISEVALNILDTYGLADVSMRRVASTLGVAPGALYWHISNKQELIANLAEIIIAPLVDAPPADPATACSHLRAALLAHRDGAEVVITAVAQPGSTVARQLATTMHRALAPGQVDAPADADSHAAAEGLLHMTLGAAYVHQSAAQLAEATGTESASGGADTPRAIELLLAGLRASISEAD